MKKLTVLFILILLLSGCTAEKPDAQIVATTLPVYEFTVQLCQGTGLTVNRLVTESVSCLHDYTLQVRQMRAIEGAQAVILSGGGLEAFLEDALGSAQTVIDASVGLSLLESHHDHAHDHGDAHHHEEDPHFWLSPAGAKIMAANICEGLAARYPEHAALFSSNLNALLAQLDALQAYGEEKLADLSCRELITFHDGFSYFAESFGLSVLKAVEEESGSEASAATLIGLVSLVNEHGITAIFTETNGATAAAQVIAAETGVQIFTLDMAMAGDSYFDAMYRNIDTVWEALQ